MSDIAVRYVDVYPVRWTGPTLEALALRRSPLVRSSGAWEAVHGHIEPGELPVAAALREFAEETGLRPARCYNLSRMESFYLHATDQVALIPVFAMVVGPDDQVTLSREHDECRWLPLPAAMELLAWPRERRALADIGVLLAAGDAGPLEAVLRVV